ncbi:hypothetical protein G8G18_002543 [Vibrio parahaemolyticus]|nr:hypothetical protein [Vibrio parahaemolyticus]
MSELEQAIKLNQESKQFRDEARKALSESRELLDKTIRFNDQANINQRRIALAVSSLLPESLRNDFNLNEVDIDNTAETSRQNVTAIEQREVFDIVHAINVLAMANTDVLHVFTEFRASYKMFEVQVYSLGNEARNAVFMAEVDITTAYALQMLLHIESNLTELIIEAREEAEAKAEVEA